MLVCFRFKLALSLIEVNGTSSPWHYQFLHPIRFATRRRQDSTDDILRTGPDRPSEVSANICSSMTSDGSAYVRFRRALETGNAALVIAAAQELPRVALDDALTICLVFRDGDPERYERAAVRWLGRFALEARGVTVAAIRRAADALDALPERPDEAMGQPHYLCVAHGIT
jgi:hypothetical protein